MIRNIINNSKNYNNYQARERVALSSLFNIIKNELNIEKIVHKMLSLILNNKNDEADLSSIKEDINNFIDISSEYFKAVTEIDIYINNKDNKNHYLQYIEDLFPLIEYNNETISLSINDSNEDYSLDELKNKISNIKKDNIDTLESYKSRIYNDFTPRNVINILSHIRNYLIYIDYYMSSIILDNSILLYSEYSTEMLNNKINKHYYIMLCQECEQINKGASILSLKTIHDAILNKMDAIFIEGISDISSVINDHIYKYENMILEINSDEDVDDITISEVDSIAIFRHVSKDIKNSSISELDMEEDTLCQPGNKYSKNNIKEFLNNALLLLKQIQDNFNELVKTMNINILDTIDKSGGIFDDENIFVFSLNKKLTQDELKSMSLSKPVDYTNSNKLFNKYKALLDKHNAKVLVDTDIKVNLDAFKELGNKYFRLPTELIEFLTNKIFSINGKRIFTLESISELCEEYPEITKLGMIPLTDVLYDNAIVSIDNKGFIFVVKQDGSKYAQLYTDLYDLIFNNYLKKL